MKSQTSQGQQPIKSTQPANAKSPGKKLVTKNGNFLVNFLNFFFFMTPDGKYLIWNPTLKYGLLPNSQEWNRLRKECNVPIVALTMEERLAAQSIYDALKLDRYHGLTPLQRSLATVHRNLYLRQKEKEAAATTTEAAPAKRFVLVKASQPKQIPAHTTKKQPRKKIQSGVINITSFSKELGVDPSIPVEVRKAGENLVIHGNFSNTNTLSKATGFSALYKIEFLEN